MIIIPMNKYREEMVEALKGLMAIPSVKAEPRLNMPYGKGCFDALNYMLDLADSMDLDCKNLAGHLGSVSYGKGDETFAILTHIDVVPAGDGWKTDPFQPVVIDGKIFGRGAVDDKGAAIASMFALYAVRESCVKLNKKIKLLFGCDEESGWGDIDYYKAHFKDPEYMITPDAGFPMINREKGLLHVEVSLEGEKGTVKHLKAGSRPNIVPNKAECLVEIDANKVREVLFESPAEFRIEGAEGGTRISVEGKASHGSHPEVGINALSYLIKLLAKLPLKGGAVDRAVIAVNDLIGTGYNGEKLGIADEDELVGALTVNLGAMEADETSASVKLDMRTPIHTDLDELFQKVSERFSSYGMDSREMHKQPSHYVKEDSFIVDALKRAYEACFSQKCECLPCAGATYARAFENGIAFGPCDINADRGEHGPNEFIYVDELVKLSEVLACAILSVAGEGDLSGYDF